MHVPWRRRWERLFVVFVGRAVRAAYGDARAVFAQMCLLTWICSVGLNMRFFFRGGGNWVCICFHRRFVGIFAERETCFL